MYPTIFALGTANLGRHTRRGAGILVMGVSGGAVFPPIQGAVADAKSTRLSYVVSVVGFVYILGYVTVHWLGTGRHIMRVKDVVSDAPLTGATGGVLETVHYDGDKTIKSEEIEQSSQ